MDFRKVGVWAVTIFLGAVFFMVGTSKAMQPAMWQERFVTQWGLPPRLAVLVALAEMTGAVLILVPRTAVYGGAIVAAVMIGASGTHVVAGELGNLVVTVVLGGLAAFVAWFRCPCVKKE